MANTQVIAKLKGHIGHLVAKYNRMEEEELQSQLMARGPYMIDEDDLSNSYHEHVQATTILESEEIVDNKVEEENEQIEPPSTPNFSNDKEVKLLPSSLSFLGHIMNPKVHLLNVSMSHLMPKFSRTYAHKCTN